ncbi:S9 family peptidase [Chitinophaga polysaccharea]|uniref:alpha/beta hydrolase family protein n=1 Tax=Chitinophaga polysaccharea TaxID=1293035 RepID=UPI0014553223|nr:prolyl oligopeptidase family serine peptidase [Chitinophaga polysaccharea]NLR62304.1 S9 family peptidase [Chitinophaga polysaccharea]
MKIFNYAFLVFSLMSNWVFVQNATCQESKKPAIDSFTYSKWKSVDGIILSNDGRYAYYVINNEPVGSFTMVVKECKGNWELRVPGGHDFRFAADSHRGMFLKPNDTLCIIKLGGTISDEIANVKEYGIAPTGIGGWFVYRNIGENSIAVRSFSTKDKRLYLGVNSYTFSSDGSFLLLNVENKDGNNISHTLSKVDFPSLKMTNIWTGYVIEKVVISASSKVFAFTTSSNTSGNKSMWFWSQKSLKPYLLFDNLAERMGPDVELGELLSIEDDDKCIFFLGGKKNHIKRERVDSSTVNIWSYFDAKLRPGQVNSVNDEKYFSATVNVETKYISKLTNEDEWVSNTNPSKNVSLICGPSGNGDLMESEWNDSAKITTYLSLLKSSEKRPFELKELGDSWISPNGKFVVCYDRTNACFVSYDVATSTYRSIAGDIDTSKTSLISYYTKDRAYDRPRGIAGWLENDESVLLYDRFDIWLVDPMGIRKSINLTNGYGYKNNIVFYLALADYSGGCVKKGEYLILNALNIGNKQNGFYRVLSNKQSNPEELTMGNYIYQLIRNPYVPYICNFFPIKAKNASRYIVRRMSATEAPNYFFTEDFRSFIPISDVQPEKEYNWYFTELHKWRDLNGGMLQGVLYKPENFDSTKKYPVIIHYYEKKSYGLNMFIKPENLTSSCDINIPTYVSNGYLVFTPDIDYKVGEPMNGTYSSVVSAAKYLSTFTFVNAQRIGIGGCSFGGIQTNYLVTHSTLFAAAYSACSMSDFVSAYGGLFSGRAGLQSYFEPGGQARMGGTLWQATDAYIKNSAIFSADKVTTPVLIMQVTGDPVMPFAQAVEFFTALRRLGKRAWLLEYTDTPTHGVSGISAKDFSVRMFQFFNHYLKDEPAPMWMTRGIPAKMKGIDNGLKLDSSGVPGKGLLKESLSGR